MTIKFLLDSNVISEPSRPVSNEHVLNRLNHHRSEIGVASVVLHELLYGCWRLPNSKRRDSLWKYIQESVLSLPVFDYGTAGATWHATQRVRLSKIGKPPAFADGQIASTAFSNGLILVTNNVKDFQIFEDLIIQNWFEVDSENRV
jgi:tRNA(fMet)-specific endonuclease VapC